MLTSAYKETIKYDEMVKFGIAQYDQNTGDMLTHWDIVMAHIHPIRHSFSKDLKSTLWYELHDPNEANRYR